MLSRPSRWGVVVLLVALAGCANVPTSGPVHVGQVLPGVTGLDTRNVKNNVRITPPLPQKGQTRTGVVTGFLDALVASDGNYGIARLFLAPGTSWNSTSTITLYDQNSEQVHRLSPSEVQVAVERVGVIDQRGYYRVQPGEIAETFHVIHELGEWRIQRLPQGVLLSTSDAQPSLQQAELYYLNPTQNRVVPVPILVQSGQPGLATTLVQDLLSGPREPDAGGLLTAAPHGVGLVGNVPIDGSGIAEVDLSGDVQQAAPIQLQRLSAQIIWTLRQVPGISGVRLLENGTPLSAAGVPADQSIDAWRQYDADLPPQSKGALYSNAGVVSGIGRSAPDALATHRVSSPVVSADGAKVAGVQDIKGRPTLVVGSTIGRAQSQGISGQLSAPAVDPAGDVYVIDTSAAGVTITEVMNDGARRSVGLDPSLVGRPLDSLAISRDGSRVALVVGRPGRRSLVVGVLSAAGRGTGMRISAVRVVVPGVRDVSDVAWANSSRLVSTAIRSTGGREVIETTVDGYHDHGLSTLGLPSSVDQVAAAPHQPVLAGAADGIWSLANGHWQRVSTGTDPSYAG